MRLSTPGETEAGVVVDLLFGSSGIEPEVVAAADPLEDFTVAVRDGRERPASGVQGRRSLALVRAVHAALRGWTAGAAAALGLSALCVSEGRSDAELGRDKVSTDESPSRRAASAMLCWISLRHRVMRDQSAGQRDLQQRVEELEDEVAELRRHQVRLRMARGWRKRSRTTFLGLPLYDIAVGPDPEKGEMRGHARGVFAFGDIASGVFAVGGLAVGVIAFGGGAIGLVGALGGFALGGLAVGGAAVGAVAIGGGAIGYYALGGGAAGAHMISGIRQDPEAVHFFSLWVPGFADWLRSVGR